MITDKLCNSKLYSQNLSLKKAFDFLLNFDINTPDGKIEIEKGAIIANIDSYFSKPFVDCKYESHQRFIDIQCLFHGAEYIAWHRVDQLEINEKYDKARDVAFYKPPVEPDAIIKVMPDMFTMFFPEDAHMPQIMIHRPNHIKKVVMKIDVSLVM